MPRRKQDRPQRMKCEESEQDKESLTKSELTAQEDETETRSESSSSPATPLTITATEVCPPQEKVTSELMNYSPVSSLSLESPSPPTVAKIQITKEDSQGDGAINLVDTPLDFSLKKNDNSKLEEPLPNGLPEDGPLDLSIPRRRKGKEPGVIAAKISKLEPHPRSPWGYSAPRTLTSPTSVGKSRTEDWNGRVKSKYDSNKEHKKSWVDKNNKISHIKNETQQKSCRQNPWQSQWISRSGDQTKDVFTCVWCKESFKSLSEMTVHMKQSSRCGVAGIQTSPSTSQSTLSSTAAPSVTTTSSDSVVKETVSLPRKLVRGQDVWLGKGAEQTRQILKCMWCGQSFKSLADMTTHMRVTQHYTNIISQEQIISWRTPEDKMTSQSHVNAVLTCKVCDQAFGSLKELSYHMVKNSHYKEHILRSITDGGSRRRQNRERRKKSLPVRKLLELERMEMCRHSPGNVSVNEITPKKEVIDGKIACEECTERVDAKDFVQHIKKCGQGSSKNQQESISESQAMDTSDEPSELPEVNSPNTESVPASESPESHVSNDKSKSETKEQNDSTSVLNAIEKLIEKSFEPKGRRTSSSTGILQRLGIDEELCPPWQPSLSPNMFYSKSVSESVAKSPSGGNLTPGLNYEEQPLFSNLSPHSSSSSGVDQNTSFRDLLSQNSSPALNPCNSDTETECTEPISAVSGEPLNGSTSEVPMVNRNGTETITPSVDEDSQTNPSNKISSSDENKEILNTTEKKLHVPVEHPLRELQKLLDKTDTHLLRSNLSPAPSGSILAFSWACTESNSNDSLLKCAFCDTHFVSKGAYRHHLSKTHFIKDSNTSDPSSWFGSKVAGEDTSNNSVPKDSPVSSEESPHSKFLKYTELAKQLSSKYV